MLGQRPLTLSTYVGRVPALAGKNIRFRIVRAELEPPVPVITTIITLEPCALNAKFHHFIKFPYFVESTEGVFGAERRPKDKMTSR
jgi:hypothetical protein